MIKHANSRGTTNCDPFFFGCVKSTTNFLLKWNSLFLRKWNQKPNTIPLISRVRGPCCKLQAPFFPLQLFMAQVRRMEAMNWNGRSKVPYSYSTDQENEVKRISTLSELQVVDDVMANILFKKFKTIKSNVCKNIYISTLFELGVVDDIMANILFKNSKR